MGPSQVLKLYQDWIKLTEETIEVSHDLLRISEAYDKELDKDMVYESIKFLEERKKKLYREVKEIEKEIFT